MWILGLKGLNLSNEIEKGIVFLHCAIKCKHLWLRGLKA